MTDPEKPEPRGTAAILERIRNRRAALGLSGTELARRADISPSYVSLIERGLKVPEEDVAARLAHALEDDEDLYRAWARAERYGLEKLDQLQRLGRLTRDAQSSRLLASGREIELLGRAMGAPPQLMRARRAPAPAAPPASSRVEEPRPPIADQMSAEDDLGLAMDAEPSDRVVEVPVLPAGTDPRRMLDADALPPLHLDARLLGTSDAAGLFAYELDREAAARLGPLAAAGDFVIFTRRVRRLAAERVYAVRGDDGRIRLGRVLFKGNALLLLPAASSDIEVVPLREDEPWRDRVVGAVVLTLKRWS
jgi:transcriptional regulator with XRE-family HTH domain